MIQNLDPVGCACSGLQECLLVQAKALEAPVPLVELLIKNHLDDLIKKDYKEMIQTVMDTEVKPYEPNKKLN